MSERLFLRQKGVILGPFPVERLRNMLDRGVIAPDDQLSSDKVQWSVAADYFVEALPEEKIPDPEIAPVACPAQKCVDTAVEKTDAPQPAPVKVAPFPQSVAPQEQKWYHVLALVISQLWNAPGALAMIAQLEGKLSAGAGRKTLALALFLLIFGNVLFGGRYPAGGIWIGMVSYANLLTQFFAVWLILALCRGREKSETPARAAGAFQTAAALSLNGAAAHLCLEALLFLLLPKWSPNRLRLALPLLIGGFFTALFFVNSVLAVRQYLTEHTRWSNFADLFISIVLNALCAFVYFQSVLYTLIFNAGVTL